MLKTNQIKTLSNSIDSLTYRVRSLESWRRETQRKDRKSISDILSSSMEEEQKIHVDPVIPTQLSTNYSDRTNSTNLGEAVSAVYPKLVSWLLEPSNKRVGSWSKLFSVSNEVRQLLFERDRKATEKYGAGLQFGEGPLGLVDAARKIGDAIFFLYKFMHNKTNTKTSTLTEKVEQEKVLKQIDELITLLQSLSSDIKKQNKPL